MIREDPARPGVFVVDVSAELVEHLSLTWSTPVQVRIDEGELVSRIYTPLGNVREELRQKVVALPPDTAERDTYRDGYASGLREALFMVAEAHEGRQYLRRIPGVPDRGPDS